MDELNEIGVKLVLVSIGKPEIGKRLVEHLQLPKGDEYLFVDPENALYDSLQLNRGVRETFYSIETPFSFLNRLTKPNGMKQLGQVLSKWNRGMFYCCCPDVTGKKVQYPETHTKYTLVRL